MDITNRDYWNSDACNFAIYYFFRIAKAKPSNKIVPMLAFIYVLTIIAMVEISLDLFYFMAIGLLYGMSLDEEKRIKQKNYKDQSLNRKRLISATAAS